MSEENPLENVDLRAITAPRAPSGFADGVLARFATTEAAIGVAKRRRVRRAVWIGMTAVTALAATLAVVVLWPHGARSGSFTTTERHELDVAGVTVVLDRGASIAWTVEHGDVHVDQRGGAIWTVPADHHLRVEVAGVGAVDATNATLHVEARMNLLDGNMIAATVTTAALVTALTATVIHGRAEIEGSGNKVTIEAGRSAAVSPTTRPVVALSEAELARVDKTLQTVERLVKQTPVAVQLVFSGDAEWFDDETLTVENAIDHVELPPGSTIGASAYTAGNTTLVEALPPSEHFREIWPAVVERFHENTAGDLVKGVRMGLGRLRLQQAPRRVLVIIGNGNDTSGESARAALADIGREASASGIEVRAIVEPGGDPIATTIERAGIATVDAHAVDLTRALADAMGGTVRTPPKAVMVVFESSAKWLTAGKLAALGEGLSRVNLPAGSRLGAVAYSAGARIQVPLEPPASFTAAQLGIARDYPAKAADDVKAGLSLAAEQLARAPEPDKLLVVIGSLGSLDEVSAVLDDIPGKYRHAGVDVRVIHDGQAGASVTQWLDPKGQELLGPDNEAKLRALTAAVVAAVR